jgi:predicted glycoside hydrolase/deacetylase ChbG (UPF0249 family)
VTSLANRLLGYPDDARLLIVNADDLGMSGAVNEAIARTLKAGVVRSTSLMTPWPGAADAMRMLAGHPDVSVGVHLSVVCDMPAYRWGPLAPPEEVPSLVAGDGRFHGLERRSELLAGARLDELEIEFRAQIEAALAGGLRPTHLDWHCLHHGGRTDVYDLTLGLAREYGLAVRVSDRALVDRLRSQGRPSDDHELLDSYGVDPDAKPAHYVRLLRDLPAGLSEWAVHPAIGDDEQRAIEPESWRVRQTDYEFLVSEEARDAIRSEGIVLLSYAPLQERWRST